jgi:hypothetical protein
MRVRIKSSASLNVPPGSVVDVVRFLLVFMFECVTVSRGAGAATAEPQVDPTPRPEYDLCAVRLPRAKFYVASPIPLLAPVMTTTLSLIPGINFCFPISKNLEIRSLSTLNH